MTLMAGSFDGPVPGKRCSYCKQVLPLRLFEMRKGRPRKLNEQCIKCRHGFTRATQYAYDELTLGCADDD